MPGPAAPSLLSWFVGAILVLAALGVYGWQVAHLRRAGGRVRGEELGLPDLLMTLVFAGFFTMVTAAAALGPGQESHAVTIDKVLPNSLVFVAFVVGIAGFMRYRGLSLRRIFGLNRLPLIAVLPWAVGLLGAAFPLIGAGSVVTDWLNHGRFEPQPLVDLFSKVARERDYPALAKILVSAVVIAPVCEEFLFRGFFYGVWKRYIGPLGAGFLASLLFAAFHTSVSAFGGLFVLALCANVAYERTGSLLVPITMHGLFNLTSLLFLYGGAQGSAAP